MSEIRRYDEIMKSALANMIAKQDRITDFNEGSIIHTILDTVARLVERAYIAIRQGFNEQLEYLPYSPFGFEKKSGQSASGTVIFSREKLLDSVSIIPKGTRISDGTHYFTTTESGRIESNALSSDEINVLAEESGSDYNISKNAINSIESIVPADVVSVTNTSAFYGGTDEETDSDFQARFKNYINGLSGTNTYAIKAAALNVDGVRSVSVVNHKPPLNDVYNVSIYVDDGSGSASESVIEAVQNIIEGDDTSENQGHLAPGINARVLAPAMIPINITASVKVFNKDSTEAKTDLEEKITEYTNSLAVGESFVISALVSSIMESNYVKDFTVISPSANIETTISQIARIGTISLSISESE